MKKIIIILSILSALFLIGCTDNSTAFKQFMIDLDSGSFTGVETVNAQELATNEVNDYLKNSGYDNTSLWEIEANILLVDNNGPMIKLYIKIQSTKAYIDYSTVVDVRALVEGLYNIIEDYDLENNYIVTAYLRNANQLGNDWYTVNKSSNPNLSKFYLRYYHDDISLNLFEEQKSIIDELFFINDVYEIDYTYVCYDPTVEDYRKDTLSFTLEFNLDASVVKYRLFDSISDVVIDFSPEELYQALFTSYPEVIFEYLE